MSLPLAHLRFTLENGASPARILIADGQRLVRAGLRALLQQVADFQVAGEAGNGLETLRLNAELAPDLILMDTALPELSGFATLERLRQSASPAKVVMLSMAADQGHAERSLALGASGFVAKDASPGELLAAVRGALRDEIWLSGSPSRALDRAECIRPSSGDPLTPRQRQVLRLIAEGVGTRGIADQLGLSIKTVETHRAQIISRLGIQDIPGLVRYALLNGISRL